MLNTGVIILIKKGCEIIVFFNRYFLLSLMPVVKVLRCESADNQPIRGFFVFISVF